MDPDYYLLNQVLNELHSTPDSSHPISNDILLQLTRESQRELNQLFLRLSKTSSWHLIEEDLMDHPLLCIDCISTFCDHIVDYFDPDQSLDADFNTIRQLWTEDDLSAFGQDLHLQQLQFGTFN